MFVTHITDHEVFQNEQLRKETENKCHPLWYVWWCHILQCRRYLGVNEVHFTIYVLHCNDTYTLVTWQTGLSILCTGLGTGETICPSFQKEWMGSWQTKEFRNRVAMSRYILLYFSLLCKVFTPKLLWFLYSNNNNLYFKESVCLEKWGCRVNVTEEITHIYSPKFQTH